MQTPMPHKSARLFILLTVMLDSIGVGLIFPVMPDLIEDVTGGDLSQAALWGGLLATSFAVMQFLFGPIVGNLSDRFGRRPVMLTALAVMAADYVVMALAGSVWLLLAGRIVAGLTAATHATASAYMADISPPGERARNFGLIGAAFGAGFILGPLLGGLLASFGLRAPFWAAAAMAGANLVFGALVLPESVTDRIRRPFSWARANPLSSFRAIGRLPGLGRFLALHTLYTLAFFVYPAIWAYYGKARFGWDASVIGFSLALFGISLIAVQGMGVAPAIRHWGERKTTLVGFLIEVGTLIFYGFVTSGFWALVVTPLSAASGIAGPALQAMMSNLTPNDQQGELQGVLSSLAALASGLSPILMTGVFFAFTRPGATVYAPGAPFLLAAFLMVVCVILLVARPRAAAHA
ncbi:TCR/Tet family MFS transporter [Ostreiculturibacter nitratireducens]|uniref:TCR/Tet family MFS transporter n=1 Tax=Ostreiculturibacter nitratireducens TaxID=3075226 RepID=UPI0031B5F0AB